MLENNIKTIKYSNGEIQRIQYLKFDSFSDLTFICPQYRKEAFDKIVSLYRDFIVPKAPYIFGQLVFFHLDDTFPDDLKSDYSAYGQVHSLTARVAIELRRGLKIINGSPVFLTENAKIIYSRLKSQNYISIVRGILPNTTILPVGNKFGFLSECKKNAKLKFNSSFFLMDRFDCQSVYDELGSIIGLYAKDGEIFNCPMFGREALIARKDGSVKIEIPQLKSLAVSVANHEYNSQNSRAYMRPAYRKTPECAGWDLVIIGRKIAAVKRHGNTFVPTSGFVLSVDSIDGVSLGDEITFTGMEDVSFALQVGNSVAVNGVKTEKFISPFYNIKRLWSISFPPSLYPLDFEKARAPRIALGSDKNNTPMLVWAEGPGKFEYRAGEDSCGASLLEMSEICADLGMYNGINLDGGGSAQILVDNSRSLKISDRYKSDNNESERAIPIGLAIM